MCPDKEIISAFCDKELNEEWSSKISFHINSCSKCSAYYKKISGYSKSIQAINVPDEEIIKERIFEAINRKQQIYIKNLWRKRVEVSLPALVAALLVFILSAGVGVGYTRRSRNAMMLSESKEMIVKEPVAKLIKMEDAVNYFSGNDDGFDILITIPVKEDFTLKGEPMFVREADYKRSR